MKKDPEKETARLRAALQDAADSITKIGEKAASDNKVSWVYEDAAFLVGKIRKALEGGE